MVDHYIGNKQKCKILRFMGYFDKNNLKTIIYPNKTAFYDDIYLH